MFKCLTVIEYFVFKFFVATEYLLLCVLQWQSICVQVSCSDRGFIFKCLAVIRVQMSCNDSVFMFKYLAVIEYLCSSALQTDILCSVSCSGSVFVAKCLAAIE